LDESEVLAKAEDPEEKYIKEILPLKVKQSLKYLERSNLWTDFLVILKTIFNLIKI